MNIAIDVTPILPNGECGGATQLVRELLRGLGNKATSDQSIFLNARLRYYISTSELKALMDRYIRAKPAAKRKGS
jgi:hypothetical protein